MVVMSALITRSHSKMEEADNVHLNVFHLNSFGAHSADALSSKRFRLRS